MYSLLGSNSSMTTSPATRSSFSLVLQIQLGHFFPVCPSDP